MSTHYLEDLREGQTFLSAARTVTETDLTMFSMVTGDWNAIHCDEEFAKTTPFGQRVVHGLFGTSLMLGFLHQIGILEGSALALLNIDKLTFKKPILIGDTLHLRLTILSTRPTKDGARGIVGRRFELLNQRGETVQDMTSDVMVKRRPGSA
jgi:acyl dehydratase